MKEIKQWNARVDKDIHHANSIVVADLNWTSQHLTELAFAALYNSHDRKIKRQIEQVREAVKERNIALPFEMPATPSNNNARHNGIVGVEDSNSSGSTKRYQKGNERNLHNNTATGGEYGGVPEPRFRHPANRR